MKGARGGLPGETAAEIEAIRADRTSGAVELTARAAESLLGLAGWDSPGSLEEFREALAAAAVGLAGAQPAMASIFNLANRALLAAAEARGVQEAQEAVRRACLGAVNDQRTALLAIRRHSSRLILDGMTVLTHSFSATVLEALLQARDENKRIQVICTESRPLREGITLAKRLAAEGIPVTLFPDAALFTGMMRADLAVTGADTVHDGGLVNKIGTALLALAASACGVPCYALCGGDKLLPLGRRPPVEPLRDPSEILDLPTPGVTVENRYFETTPLEYFTGIITEDGLLAPGELRRRLAGAPVHPSLAILPAAD